MIDSMDTLFRNLEARGITLSEESKQGMVEVDARYKTAVTDYYFGLIDWEDENCPVHRQCLPDPAELSNPEYYTEDPLCEQQFSTVPFLVHKYYDRVAFMASNRCFMYCRHCTRKNTVISEKAVTKEEFQKVPEYLMAHPEVKDVLITGGDPFTLPMEKLEYFIKGIRSVPTVETVRIGTRAIVVNPDAVTDQLADMLAKYHPVWVFTQFNHAKEITEKSAAACDRLLKRGIPVGNQSVLLKGINDTPDKMEALLRGLIRIRVRPYYLYECDRVMGTAHFATDYRLGLELLDEMRYKLPGYAVPKFVIDADGENGGKVTLEKNHILEDKGDCLILSGRKKGLTTRYNKGVIG